MEVDSVVGSSSVSVKSVVSRSIALGAGALRFSVLELPELEPTTLTLTDTEPSLPGVSEESPLHRHDQH